MEECWQKRTCFELTGVHTHLLYIPSYLYSIIQTKWWDLKYMEKKGTCSSMWEFFYLSSLHNPSILFMFPALAANHIKFSCSYSHLFLSPHFPCLSLTTPPAMSLLPVLSHERLDQYWSRQENQCTPAVHPAYLQCPPLFYSLALDAVSLHHPPCLQNTIYYFNEESNPPF